MRKFIPKPEPVEAIEWTGKNFKEVKKFFPVDAHLHENTRLFINNGDSLVEVDVGGYLFANGIVATANGIKANYDEVM